MNALLQNFISARDALYDHCGFKEDWITYPIEAGDIEKYWHIENEVWKQDGTKEESEALFDGNLFMANTVDNLKDKDKGEYYDADLVRHCFFHGKSVYGKYARYSSVVDDFTDINMTEDDYIQLCIKWATENAISKAKQTLQHHTHKIEEAIENWRSSNLDNECTKLEDKSKEEKRLKWLMGQMTNPDVKLNEL